MKTAAHFLQNKQAAVVISVALSFVIAVTGYNQNVHFSDSHLYKPYEASANFEQFEFETVQLWDRSLGMALGTMMIPKGWIFEQDIALNLQSGLYDRYHTDLLSPEGQLIRSVNSSFYSPTEGIGFDETWRVMVEEAIRYELDEVMIGHLRPSTTLAGDKTFQETASMMRAQGIRMEALEVPFSGWLDDERYQGVAYVAHAKNPWMGDMGVIAAKLVTSPAYLFNETVKLDKLISGSYERNRMYELKVSQVQMQALNRNQPAWQQPARSLHSTQYDDCYQNYAYPFYWFDGSYGLTPHYDELNSYWYDSFFGSWNTNAGHSYNGGYSSTDHFLDAITGYSTFEDPYSGYNVRIEGHYRYNYTDGYGNYYGTDDPLFDPNREFSGYWYPIDPLSP